MYVYGVEGKLVLMLSHTAITNAHLSLSSVYLALNIPKLELPLAAITAHQFVSFHLSFNEQRKARMCPSHSESSIIFTHFNKILEQWSACPTSEIKDAYLCI